MPRRRKFYAKSDYQFIPNVGGANKNASVHVNSAVVYKYRIPQQLRLEPWDFDDRNPHGIQLEFVNPPGAYADMDADMEDEWRDEGEFVQGDQNVEAPDDEDMEEAEQQGRGQRRRREEDVGDGAPQGVRRRVNPALFQMNPMYQNPPQRGERRRREQNPNLNPDLIDRERGGRMGGAVRLRRFNPIERRPRPPLPPRTPGIAAEAARDFRNAVVRGNRVRRHLDFEQFTQEERTRKRNEGALAAADPGRRRPRGPEP